MRTSAGKKSNGTMFMKDIMCQTPRKNAPFFETSAEAGTYQTVVSRGCILNRNTNGKQIYRALVAPFAHEVGSPFAPKGDLEPDYASHASSPFSDSTLLFSAVMAQIKTPKTAFATTSATEYPICSPAVAVTPEMPSILMMYTKG